MDYYKYQTEKGWTVTNKPELWKKAKGRLIHVGLLTEAQLTKLTEAEGYKVITAGEAVEVQENED